MEMPTVDRERRETPASPGNLAAFDMRAHFSERADDAIHGPPGERFVAANAGVERLRREDSGEHADGGPELPASSSPAGSRNAPPWRMTLPLLRSTRAPSADMQASV